MTRKFEAWIEQGRRELEAGAALAKTHGDRRERRAAAGAEEVAVLTPDPLPPNPASFLSPALQWGAMGLLALVLVGLGFMLWSMKGALLKIFEQIPAAIEKTGLAVAKHTEAIQEVRVEAVERDAATNQRIADARAAIELALARGGGGSGGAGQLKTNA